MCSPPRPLLLLLLALLVLADSASSVEICHPVDDAREGPPAPGTYYISRNNTQVLAGLGDTVSLPCQIRKTMENKVSWIYKPTRRLLAVQDRSFTQDERVSTDFDISTDTWTLTIRNVSADDSGYYECQLSSHPWERLQVRLKVADPDGAARRKELIVLVKDYNEPGFHVQNAGLCPERGRDIKVVVLVQSAAANSNVRSVIRHSWARPAIARDDVVFAFVLARVADPALQRSIDYEQSLYGDIIQANFIDHYNNLTLKTLASLEWVDQHCPEALFMLKVDDDVFLNVNNLITFVEQHRDARRTIFGNVVFNPMPDRNKASRYYVSPKIWDKTKYPRYTGGPLYLVSSDSVRGLRQRVLERPYFFIEDVTVTGIGAKLAGVQRRRAPEFFTYSVPASDTCLFRLLVGVHKVSRKDMADIWARVNDRRIQCPYVYSPADWKPCMSLKAQESLKHCVLTLFSSKSR